MALLLLAAGLVVAQSVRTATSPAQDFVTRYAAAQVTAAGGDPYDPHQLSHAARALEPRVTTPFPFLDPPASAVALRPLLGLPLVRAQLLWLTLSLFSLAALGALAASLAGAGGLGRGLGALLAVVMSPAREVLSDGQVDAVYLLPLVLAWWLHARRPEATPMAVALLASLSLIKPQTSLLPALALIGLSVARNGGRAIAGALLAGSLLLGGPLLLAPQLSYGAWLHRLTGDLDPSSPLVRASLAGLGALAVATAGWFAARRLTRIPEPRLLLLLAAAGTGLLAGFVRWNPQWFLALCIPVIFLLARARRPAEHEWLLAGALGLVLASGLGVLTYFVGAAHAVLPLLIAALVTSSLAVSRRLTLLEAALALGVNACATVPPLSGNPHRILGLAACTLVVIALCGTGDNGGDTPPRPGRLRESRRRGRVAPHAASSDPGTV